MSSGSPDEQANIREEFSREIRQFTGINASFLRVAATRMGGQESGRLVVSGEIVQVVVISAILAVVLD